MGSCTRDLSLEFSSSNLLALKMLPGRQQSPWQGWSLCLLLLPLVLAHATEGANYLKEEDVGQNNNNVTATTANVTSTTTTTTTTITATTSITTATNRSTTTTTTLTPTTATTTS